jgi:predicted Zn finger-like uncharacterized protein
MKFLCGNCKAKYQIADEKISGRTLRMKCRRCQHDIIIRGQEEGQAEGQARIAPAAAMGGAARSPQAPRPQAPAKRAPAPASALGADFRRSVGGPSPKRPPPPAPPAPVELWHVAINDVPVGPIRREEVEKKIQTGAVNGESLCWREGFDDWRPLKDVAELASLLRKQRPPSPSRRPPVGRGIGQRRQESRPRIRPSQRPGPDSRPQAAAAPDNVVPIGGRHGGSASVDLEDYDEEATRVSDSQWDGGDAGPTVPEPGGFALPKAAATLSAVPRATGPEPDPLADMFGGPQQVSPAGAGAVGVSVDVPLTSTPPSRRKRVIPIGAWIAIAAAGAFGVTLAVFVGTNLLKEPEPIAENTVGPTTETSAEPDLVLDDELGPEVAESEDAGALDVEDEATPTGNGTRPRVAAMTGGTQPNNAATRNLTAEQRALLERMGGAGSAAANIDTSETSATTMRAAGGQLTAEQMRSTVNANKRSAQRCYELAIRGAGEPPTIRLDVSLTVAASGRVSNVNVSGNDFGGLKACIQSNVTRWRFPASGGSTPLQFPLVFQPGA